MTNDLNMGEIITTVPVAVEVQGMSDADLKSAIRDAIGMTEDAVRRLADLWSEALRRDIDLSDIRFALAPFLPLVAKGKLLPALVVTLAGQTRTLQRLADLPIDDQARLADGAPVAIYNPERGVEEKPLRSLTFPELASVIRDGHILTVEQQRTAIANRRTPRPRKSKIVDLRLDQQTYQAASAAAAEAGMTIERYLREIILRQVGAK